MPDEQIRAQSDELPEDVHGQEIIRDDDAQHGKRKESEVRIIARKPDVARHVFGGEQIDEKTDERDDDEHYRREVVDHDAEIELQRPDQRHIPQTDPGERVIEEFPVEE